VPVYNPFTGDPDGTGRSLFPGNVIPSSLISAPVANLLSKLSGPNVAGANAADNNFTSSGVETFDSNQFDLRGDHYLTENLRYFVRYDYLGAHINAPGPLGLYGGPAYTSLGFSGISDARNQNVADDVSYVLNPTLLTDIRFGMSRYRVTVTAQDQMQQLATTIGIPGLNIPGNPDTYGLPDLNVNGTGGFREGSTATARLTSGKPFSITSITGRRPFPITRSNGAALTKRPGTCVSPATIIAPAFMPSIRR
jgi:hypothetical protein